MIFIYLTVIFLIFEYLIAILKLSEIKVSDKIFLFIRIDDIQSKKINITKIYCILGFAINICSLYLINIDSIFFLSAVTIHCIILSLISKTNNKKRSDYK